MSWFDTKGLASLAKTALKEAQKQIDKALDIQEEESSTKLKSGEGERPKKFAKKLPGGANREKSHTDPNTPVATFESDAGVFSSSSNDDASLSITRHGASTWGSFTGSFFENNKSKEMVTTPPKGGISTHTEHSALAAIVTEPSSLAVTSVTTLLPFGVLDGKRQSVTSNSDSVELLSSPTSPCSAMTSPSEAMKSISESVEQITTPTTSEPMTLDIDPSLPGSIVIIASDEAGDEDEDESMSYNTVMDDMTATMVTAGQFPAQGDGKASLLSDVIINPSQTSANQRPMSLDRSSCGSTEASKLFISMDDTLLESQTANSDSTLSFEEIQMLSESSSAMVGGTATGHNPLDMAKISSGPSLSDHNSNDEIETTTSSDIEIISNPNGDSSSTNSITRSSPMKSKKLAATPTPVRQVVPLLAKKGHFREPSEASLLSEDSQSESDKFLLRISELSELLEAREMSLMECGRQNADLQERNNELQMALDAMRNNTDSMDSTEKYTQRLSALEKKFQASIREKDALRIQLKAINDELETKIPKDDLAQVVSESNNIINVLRLEGEKLSKEILQQSNIIKKLRAKEKTSDALLKKNKDQITDLGDEIERLKKTLNAKEEVERSQIEAVHKMSFAKRRLEEENVQQRSKVDDLQMRLETLQASFDAVKVELQQRTRLNTDLARTAEGASNAQKEKDRLLAENKQMYAQMNELCEKLRGFEQLTTKREQKLRDENNALLLRLEDWEQRAEYLTQDVTHTTMPLMRQIDELQTALNQRSTIWYKQEKELLDALEIGQTRLKSLERMESVCEEKMALMQSRCLQLENRLSQSQIHEENAKIARCEADLRFKEAESELKQKVTALATELADADTRLQGMALANKKLEEEMASQMCHALVMDSTPPAGHHCAVNRELSLGSFSEGGELPQRGGDGAGSDDVGGISPNLSLSRNSLHETMGGDSVEWPDDFDGVSSSGRQAAAAGLHILLPYMGGHATTTLEHLQSLLKLRDGENNQLQWELSRLQTERNVLSDEISNLTMEMELIKERLLVFDALEKNFSELQHQYDALLQMYGEKVERTQELELDLLEVKEAYKAQIDELLALPKKAMPAIQ